MVSKQNREELAELIVDRINYGFDISDLEVDILPVRSNYNLSPWQIPSPKEYAMIIRGNVKGYFIDDKWLVEWLWDYGKWEFAGAEQSLNKESSINEFIITFITLEDKLKELTFIEWEKTEENE